MSCVRAGVGRNTRSAVGGSREISRKIDCAHRRRNDSDGRSLHPNLTIKEIDMELAGLEPAISVPRAAVPRMSGGIHPASSSRYPSESSARKISLYITPQTKGGCVWPRSSMGLRGVLPLERVTRIELASPAWKAGALAIVLHPR